MDFDYFAESHGVLLIAADKTKKSRRGPFEVRGFLQDRERIVRIPSVSLQRQGSHRNSIGFCIFLEKCALRGPIVQRQDVCRPISSETAGAQR